MTPAGTRNLSKSTEPYFGMSVGVVEKSCWDGSVDLDRFVLGVMLFNGSALFRGIQLLLVSCMTGLTTPTLLALLFGLWIQPLVETCLKLSGRPTSYSTTPTDDPKYGLTILDKLLVPPSPE